MQTSVFIDHLPDASSVTGRKSQIYRLTRNKAMIDLLVDDSVHWHDRDCPACGQSASAGQAFGQVFMPFLRCTNCNTIYARQVPDQKRLDGLRVGAPSARAPDSTEDEDDRSREFEFISLLNWISLSDARSGQKLSHVLDYRFCSHAPGWQDAVSRFSHKRTWSFLPLMIEAGEQDYDYADLAGELKNNPPNVVLILSEMDRVADPALLLRSIRDNAPKGTLIFIASSCADGLEYEILGANSPSFIPLDRLTIFSIRGIETLASRLGFSVRQVATPGRRDAIILAKYFALADNRHIPFWPGFFHEANKDRLHDLQILLQRSLRSSVLRCILEI